MIQSLLSTPQRYIRNVKRPEYKVPRLFTFNSTTVHQEQYNFQASQFLIRNFQLHNGTLGTRSHLGSPGGCRNFQLHNGTLGTLWEQKGFNNWLPVFFQLHNGTLGTFELPCLSLSVLDLSTPQRYIRNPLPTVPFFQPHLSFNSTTVHQELIQEVRIYNITEVILSTPQRYIRNTF